MRSVFAKSAALWGLALASSMASAGTATNTMTSVATVTDACDIVAIGLDFGLTSLPLPAAGVPGTAANTTLGNSSTGNTSNPKAATDGGASNDDELTLTVGDATTTGLISTVLTSISTTAAGVFVACTSSPTAITITSSAAGATTYNLPVTTGTAASGTFNGKMAGVGGGATASNLMSYTMTFTGAPASTAIGGGLPLNLFTAEFLAVGSIPASQAGTVVPGYYADVATAQVDF